MENPDDERAARRARLTPEQRARLAQRMRGGETPADPQRIPRRSADGPAPLSFDQQRLWLLHQRDPDSPAYNSPAALYLRGPLDRAALQRALDALLERHAVLRSTFALVDWQPAQIAGPPAPLPLPLRDLRGLPPEARADEVARLAEQEARRPFDLQRGPLLRAALLQTDHDEHVLLLALHHIVADGWSLGVLARELAELYGAAEQGLPPALPALPIQYADYAAWQRQTLQGPALERQLGYWRRQLAGAPPEIALPADRPRPAAARAARQHTLLPPAALAALAELARQHAATPFMALLAALKILLFRWTGQPDLVVGTVIVSRTRVETEPLIGCFINFLALRDALASAQSGAALLARVRDTVLEAYAHQDCPFEQVVEALRPAPGAGGNPLYNVAFLHQNFQFWQQARAFRLGPRVEALLVDLDTGVALLDLRFVVQETPAGTLLECEYPAELFAPDTVALLLEGYRAVLEQLAARPDGPLGAYALPEGLAAQAQAARARLRPQPARPAYLAPATPTQQTLAALLAELLGAAQVGLHDTFFGLGGELALAPRLIGRIAQTWQVELPLAALQEHPSLAELAALIDQRLAQAAAADEELWARLDQLSDEEAAALLARLEDSPDSEG